MGILNVTPDSSVMAISSKTAGYEHAMQMIADGASIIDIGGESTRPGASPEVEEEIRRVVPLLKLLAKQDVILSIDSSQPHVIGAAVEGRTYLE
jgi:dihydropteroate synthase